MSAYSPQPISATTIQRLQAGLRAAIDSDQALTSDTRVLDVSWRDIASDPIPGEGDDGGVGTDDEGGGVDSPTLAPASAPFDNAVPIVRETKRDTGFENWAIGLIATASILCLCMAYLCFRRGKHEPIFDSDDGDLAQGGGSASSDHFSDERTNSKEITNSKERTPLVAAPPVVNEPSGGGNKVQSTTPYRDPFIVSSGPSSGSKGAEKVQSGGGNPNQMEDASSSGSRSESESSSSDSGSQFEDEYGYENNGAIQNQSKEQSSGLQKQVNQNTAFRDTRPPPKSGGEVFSAEYSEVEVEEEYEVEYVDDDEDHDDEDHDDEGSAEYDDEYDDNYDDDDYEEDSYADDPDGIVVDSPGPGGTPILPWLARDD